MENISRRTAIKTFLAGGVALATTGIEAVAAAKKKTDVKETLKGNVRHSVSKWCFGDYKLDEFCEICKHIGTDDGAGICWRSYAVRSGCSESV